MGNIRTVEWCGKCGYEGSYTFDEDKPVVQCRNCKEQLTLCSACTQFDGQCVGCLNGSKFTLYMD